MCLCIWSHFMYIIPCTYMVANAAAYADTYSHLPPIGDMDQWEEMGYFIFFIVTALPSHLHTAFLALSFIDGSPRARPVKGLFFFFLLQSPFLHFPTSGVNNKYLCYPCQLWSDTSDPLLLCNFPYHNNDVDDSTKMLAMWGVWKLS